MKYLLILSLFIFGCATPQPKPQYPQLAGYVEGCVHGVITTLMQIHPEITSSEQANPEFYNATCMELYMRLIETENKKPVGIDTLLDRNETI